MTYQVLARKWRPKNFNELAGQTEVLAALVHGLNEQRLHHAYLFTGTRGVGKTTIARIVAKCLNCEKGISATPCDQCHNCVEIREGRFVDLIEIDAASRTKVEDTREILDNVQYAPTQGRFKVYLIDEVHMLSTHSFNALLKTLEEPPEHVKFLLATTDPQKLPITVLSRCLQFHLKNIPSDIISERLNFILNEEKIKFDINAIKLISKSAAGSLRDALSLLDQAINQGEGSVSLDGTRQMLGVTQDEILHQLARLLVQKDGAQLFNLLDTMSRELIDYQELADFLLELWYEVALKQQVASLTIFEHPLDVITELAGALTPSETQLFYQITLLAKRDLTLAPTPLLGFKMMLLRLLSFYPLNLEANTMQTQQPVKKAAIKPTAAPSKPTQAPVAPPPAEPSLFNDLPPKKLEITDWAELVNTLPLNGMAKQLARHLSFVGQEGHTFKFSLAAEHQASLNNRLQNDLTKTLKQYFAQDLVLQIEVISDQVASPAAMQAAAEQAQQLSLQEKLKMDPGLDFIKNNFNAIITDIKTLK
jgi:DNA polymerase III subunit gamma/tau